jgi:hypothetical protein
MLGRPVPACEILHGNKGYDSDVIRRQVENAGVMPNIPSKANRNGRTASRRSFTETATPLSACSPGEGLQALRHALRWSATNFLAAVCIAATISYWL